MRCDTVHTVVLVLLAGLMCHQEWTSAQFLNKRPHPTYSLERMPDTGFSCRGKVLGGYYADAETQCQMFHICVKVAGLGVQDFRFLCPNGTAFDQDSQICADWDDVDCEAATLYYSSDNFDLYRVGSGFETAAFAGEDEATFHLQRSETGDARLNREHQSQRVNQQTNYNTVLPPKRPPPPQQHRERDRDILRASSSSNFFNNRNGGKELEDDYYDNGAPNQNSEVTKKKIVRKFNNRKPVEEDYDQVQTQRPQRPTGFVNNFAGSIRPSTTTTTTTIRPTTNNYDQYQERRPNNNDQYQERRQNGRNRGGERQYNNAENFRNNNNDYNNRNQQYTVSTPAPFRAPENNRQHKNGNRQSTQYNNQFDNGQQNPTTTVSKPTYNNQLDSQKTTQVFNRQNFNNQYQPKETEKYPSTPALNNKQNVKQTDNYPSTAPINKQTYNNQYQSKQTENYPSTPVGNNQNYNKHQTKQTENYPSTTSPFKTTQYKKETENYPTTSGFTNNQNYNKQYDIPKKTTQFKETDNYPTTFAPSKQTYQKQTTQYYQPKETENYPQNTGITNKQYNTQYDNTRSQFTTTVKTTTQHTQYTPTVPKQTTQYQYSSTSPSVGRFSKQFDGSSYDDGSYNPKYNDEKYKSDDEFLKTAHSQNFASARNELISSTKGSTVTTQSPRPFSVTTPIPKVTNAPRQTQPVDKTASKKPEAPKSKQEKDVSYDYAYYDTNVGSEPDYDIGTEFHKSTKKTN